ncbi:MAG: hypothetical protein NZ920_02115 [Aigarchaeota archaeon]|nr:hypothetical protein [Aigarchaeota archaeon]MDW8092579.1 hypothetical protein [Nitrososphaerota archaeon]
MSAFTSPITVFVVMVLILNLYLMNSINLSEWNDLLRTYQRHLTSEKKYEFGSSALFRNGSFAIIKIWMVNDGLPCDVLSLFDMVLTYRDVYGNAASKVLRFNDPMGWRPINVTLRGGAELMNPVRLDHLTGVLDPGEEMLVTVRLPYDMAPDSPVYVIMTSPGGWREVLVL